MTRSATAVLGHEHGGEIGLALSIADPDRDRRGQRLRRTRDQISARIGERDGSEIDAVGHHDWTAPAVDRHTGANVKARAGGRADRRDFQPADDARAQDHAVEERPALPRVFLLHVELGNVEQLAEVITIAPRRVQFAQLAFVTRSLAHRCPPLCQCRVDPDSCG
jgi:hypothetical protein